METEILNGHDLINMLELSLARLEDKCKDIDSLNVFPVPDGDTGTNMHLTFASAVREAGKAADLSSIGAVAEAASGGALMGARGNSGVILSQLLRGIALGLKNMDRVTGAVFAGALEEGVKVAYRAIMKPVEGTILTVAKEAAREAVKTGKKKAAVAEVLRAACRSAEKALQQTPEMLPALKEAGVVDAGGKGWLVILEGFLDGLSGEKPADTEKDTEKEKTGPQPKALVVKVQEGTDLQFPYCTEVLIRGNSIDKGSLREKLKEMGDCLLVVGAEDFVRVHIHSAHPGNVLETCLQYGPLSDIKISNMDEQAEKAAARGNRVNGPKQAKALTEAPEQADAQKQPSGEKTYGIVSVTAGDGIRQIMESLGADRVILGGQTMNPSAEELVSAVESLDAGEIIILPNNSNVILTAKQVVDLTAKKVTVVPSKTVSQGLAALLAITPGADTRKTAKAMTDAIEGVKTGEITYAVRDTRINGREITKGSIIGLFEGEIASVGEKIPEVAVSLLKEMLTEDDEVCTLYYGEAVKAAAAEKLLARLEKKYSHVEFELHYGGQPLYYYIISIE